MKCNGKRLGIMVIVVLAITLILSMLSFFKKDSARNLETIKVGGVKNMEAVQELYKSDAYKAQQSAAIDQALSQIETDIDLSKDDTTVTDESGDENIISALQDIKNDTIIHGDKDARFTILEYSEFLCPFCKRQSENKTINDVIKKYPSDVNAIFRNFIVHGAAAKLSEGLECMKELGNKDKYYDFIDDMFTHQGSLDTDSLSKLASEYGASEKKMKKCIESGKYADAISKQTDEGRNLFGVSGTPGNVIVDKQTGKFILIPGAYPPEKFIEEIEKMKAE